MALIKMTPFLDTNILELKSNLTGIWKSSFTKSGVLLEENVTYFSDGTWKAEGVAKGRKTVPYSIEGSWEVIDNFLSQTVRHSSLPEICPIGFSTTIEIMNFSSQSFQYLSASGEIREVIKQD